MSAIYQQNNWTNEMLERDIERKVTLHAKATGWLDYKFTSPQNRSVPDHIFIKGGKVVFIEFKQLGEKPTKLQRRTINEMLTEGADVYVIDDVFDGCRILDIADAK